MTNKIDSNVVGLAYAEEQSLGVLPGTPNWYPLDPNEYDDFGGEITTEARTPINASRQQKKGVVVDVEAMGGFNQDLTQTNAKRLMQGFFFANAKQRATTVPINGNAANTISLTNFSAGTSITVGSGGGAKLRVGQILKLSGFANAANNKNVVITAIATDTLTISSAVVAETVTANCKAEVVGFSLGSGIAALTVSGSVVQLTRSSGSFVDFNLAVGEWIFIGGDATDTFFDTALRGYARIKAISAAALTLEECTFTPVANAGTSKTIEIYLGDYIKNENVPANIVRRTYNIERTLGQDANGTQSEYLVGAVANEFSLNLTAAEKITFDMSFMALNNELRNGTAGLKSGTRHTLPVEDAYNAANDIYQMRLFVHDPSQVTPSSLFAYVEEATLTIENGVTGLKAIGTLGAFDLNVGDFVVGGEMTIYFSTIAAVQAVKNNSDVGFNVIGAKDNGGFVYDIPLLALGGGKLEVEKDEPIRLPVENAGAENAYGYTLSATYFSYLPNAAMATVS